MILRQVVTSSTAYRWGATALFVMTAIILAALAFEYIGGMNPCELCLQQRWAYYAGIPTAFLALVLLSAGNPRAATVLFGLVALGFLANAGLGGYHAGVEWGFWAGPDTCSGTIAPLNPSGNLLESLKNTGRIVRCDEAAWRFAGLSFAGWNVLVSIAIAIAASKAALLVRDHETYL